MRKTETIYVVFKTHFDIGFTGLASEVIDSYQKSMLKSVLETCEATSSNDQNHRYVWTMSSWPLKKSLETPDMEIRKQAMDLARDGRLAWHALPFTTHTEFAGTEEFIRSLEIGKKLNREFNKKYSTAKMTDVPGHTRMLPSLLAKAGVRFLHLGCNSCANPPEVPRCFFWKGPDGNGVVTFYTKGGYGTDLVPPDDWDYPVWLALMNTSDNSGPHSADVIRDILSTVEEKLPGAKVIIGTMDDFADAFLACKPQLPVIETDLADSWIHGVATYPDEVSRIRSLRKTAMNVEGILALKKMSEGYRISDSVKELIDKAYENMILFDEHTWGLDTKITICNMLDKKSRVYEKKMFLEDKKTPEYKRIEQSWREKSQYVKNAEDAVSGIINEFPVKEDNHVSVYNILPWQRDGEVDVTGLAAEGEVFVDREGKAFPIYERDGRCIAQLENLPPVGCKNYRIETKAIESDKCPVASGDGHGGAVLENSRISVSIDGKTGCIRSFYDKINKKEWVASGGGFGGYAYDIHGKERIIQYLKDFAYDLEDWFLFDNGRPGYPWVKDKTYQAEDTRIEISNSHGLGSVEVIWKMPSESVEKYGNAPEVRMKIEMGEDSEYVDIQYSIRGKEETPFVESGHFIFPLNAEAPRYAIQKMGAVIDPEKDIQYGANTSLYCCDRWVNVSDGDHSIAFFPKDTPLLSIGENRVYIYSKDYKPKKPVLYWNAFNNQWATNFPQWIGGDFGFRCRIYPYAGAWNDGDMPKRAEEYATSLHPLKEAVECRLLEQDIENANILIFKNADDGNGYILRLQENRGKAGVITIKLTDGMGIYSTCILPEEDEEIYSDIPGVLEVKTAPFEIHTFRIVERK